MSYYARATFNRRAGMFFAAVVVIVWACMLGACASNQPREFCSVFHPIQVCIAPGCKEATTDQLTDGTAKQILAANQTYQKLCGKG